MAESRVAGLIHKALAAAVGSVARSLPEDLAVAVAAFAAAPDLGRAENSSLDAGAVPGEIAAGRGIAVSGSSAVADPAAGFVRLVVMETAACD